jgi:hypothetical protein
MATWIRVGDEEEMVTDAPAEREASATAYPMPEEPPMTRTCFCASLLYFWDAIVYKTNTSEAEDGTSWRNWRLSATFRGYDCRISKRGGAMTGFIAK